MKTVSTDNRVTPQRIRIFLGAMIVLFAIFAARLFFLQVILGKYYLALAETNRIQVISLPSSRGVIYDRNGVILARNVPSYNITITPADLPDDTGGVQTIYRTLSDLTGVPITVPGSRPSQECAPDRGIEDLVNEWIELAPYYAVKIQCDADPVVAQIIQERAADMPGVGVSVSSIRDYPNSRFTADVIGYMGRVPPDFSDKYKALGYNLDQDKIGYAGIELSSQDILAGTYGSKKVEVDAAGKIIRLLEPPTEPIAGKNIQLTIDSRLQEAATIILENKIAETRANKPPAQRSPMITGVVIAMNPQTGEILAMVSVPTYDNEKFSRYIPLDYYNSLATDISSPMLNHAISGTYPPGSIFKLSTAIGALNEKIITPDTQIICNGSISILQRFYPGDPGTPMLFYCYLRSGHGVVNFLYGLSQSCDVYFYNLGGGFPGGPVPEPGLGIDQIKRYADALGYDQLLLGGQLPGEVKGLIPDQTWKRRNKGENWATGDTYISTIGQGYVEVTPLQVLESIATVGNGGKLVKPILLKKFLDGEGNVTQTFPPQVIYNLADNTLVPNTFDIVVQPWVLQEVQMGMRLVVTQGTAAQYAQIENIPSAGKTGTAEYCDDIAQSRNLCQRDAWPTHAWYGAYAPPDNPEIAVLAFVYDGGEGSVTAGPIVRDVLKAYYQLKANDAQRTG
jgi:penicillin-binding protein 2